jgi:hypothetical protein
MLLALFVISNDWALVHPLVPITHEATVRLTMC